MSHSNTSQSQRHSQGGFALVIALGLMAFVLLLLLSITTLVRVETQSAQIQMQRLQAEQAALLSLSLALGELQKAAGADTRVTAPADIVSGGNGPRQLTGVWRSWEGLDHDSSTGFPGYGGLPDYGSKLGNYDENSPGTGRFLGWLVSQDPSGPNPDAADAPDLAETDTTVPLLSSNTLGSSAVSDEIHLEPLLNADGAGAYAWWIGGENTKANLSAPDTTPTTNEEWDQLMTSAGQPDATHFKISDPQELKKTVSRHGLNVLSTGAGAADSIGGEYFHDLTVHSRGLLTNTATGGWRRDLSLMAEQWDTLSATDLPFFTIKPGVETSASKADGENTPQSFLLYPWTEINAKTGTPRRWHFRTNAVTSWSALQDFCTQYKSISSGGASGQVVIPPKPGGAATGNLSDIRDRHNRYPVLARMHWVFSYSSKPNPATIGVSDAYIACIVATPVVTFWNPYNVELTINNVSMFDFQLSPLRLAVTVGGNTYNPHPLSLLRGVKYKRDGNGNVIVDQNGIPLVESGRNTFNMRNSSGGGQLVFKPGETHIFSPYEGIRDVPYTLDANGDVVNSDFTVELRSGYRTQNGFRFELRDPDSGNNQLIAGSAGALFKADASFDGGSRGTGNDAGIYANVMTDDGSPGVYRLATTAANVSTYWPPQSAVNNDETLGALDGRADAFCSALFGPKISNKAGILSKGTLHCNPLASYAKSSWRSDDASDNYNSMGGDHPVNWPYDFKFFMLNSWNDEGAPSGLSDETTSYIGPDHRSGLSLNRLVMAHMPLRPLQSLAQLQHFDLRQHNVNPPHQYNLIGNSHAHPLFPPDATHLDRPASGQTLHIGNYHQYDDSYVANHLLFDDWFVSSIAPDTDAYVATEARSLSKVYEEHLSGDTSLANHRYLPARPADASNAGDQATEDLTANATSGWEPWYHIASKLEVHGMFNINSTSVEAWKAMLRHLKDAKVPSLDGAGGISLDSGSGYPIGRDSVTGEAVAGGSTNNSGEGFYGATEYAGYRRFTDGQIDALATQIVAEIKARGPFLSLSEFINRRLTSAPSEQDLARAGVIEAALLYLSERSNADNPYQSLQALADEVTAAPAGTHAYQFPYAALGSTSYGYPGWARQADVLRPLAPVLSARDDTFVIRCYGDARDYKGDVIARTWGEAVVKRTADYVDLSDKNTDLPGSESSGLSSDKSVNAVNETFGRRFKVISFRWLNEDDV